MHDDIICVISVFVLHLADVISYSWDNIAFGDQSQSSLGMRGNIFSFQLPWESIQEQLHNVVESPDKLEDWPMTPQMVSQLVRVRLLHGPADLLKRVKQLKVRAEVVRLVAKLYIERHEDTLRNSPSISALLRKYQNFTVKECLLQHVFDRLAHFYPDKQYPRIPTEEHHGIIKEMQDVVEAEYALHSRIGQRSEESAFD